MYKCEILADSMNPQGDRITTFKLTYPRIIHAELMTHRMFSRNSASSRAIPFKKMVEMVEEDPFIPIVWQKDHKGMQGGEYVTDENKIEEYVATWLYARDKAIQCAKTLNSNKGNDIPVTKQLCNRLLEPFMWHTVLVTATEYDNFFELRCPKYIFGINTDKPKIWKSKRDAIKYFPEWETHNDLFWNTMNYSQADIHIQAIAEMMWDAYNESTPKKLEAGEWHIPYGDNLDAEKLMNLYYDHKNLRGGISYDSLSLKISTARAARISYTTLGDNPKIDYEADIKLHDRLLLDKHLSCFEHCARAMNNEEYETFVKGQIIRVGCEIERHDKGDYSEDVVIKKDIQGWCNNFKGFIQYRYLSK